MQPIHSTLRPVQGAPLEAAALSDRHRMGLVLQGAALLAHLQGIGWHLPDGWADAKASADGRLGGLSAAPGRLGPIQELLRHLLALCFGSGGLSGRGTARRAARVLEEAWALDLAPLSAETAVEQVLEAAPFLWEPPFGAARRSLAGRRVVAGESADRSTGEPAPEDGGRLWVVGPGSFRRRVLARAAGGTAEETLGALLASVEARELWFGPACLEDPGALASAGRFRAAVLEWERRPPRGGEERLAFARALEAIGRFERAIDAVGSDRSSAARLVRARCQLRLGRLGGARAALLRFETEPADAERTIELAELGVRTFANAGEPEAAARWVARARDPVGQSGSLAARWALLAEVAALDRKDLAAAREHLLEAEGAGIEPREVWRLDQGRALLALEEGRMDAAALHLASALRAARRGLPRFEAAGLWNDLGLARAGCDDLPGAERAFLHADRLLAGCDGPRRKTLALSNLAEIRLRRGRLAGVREILEASALENRRAGNLRGEIQDAELWARLDLACGRPEGALTRIEAARLRLRERRIDWRSGELSVLAARALGWLGRAEEAAVEWDRSAGRARGFLEPEEIPALLALAGRRDEAIAAANGMPWQPLFAAALGLASPSEAPEEVEALDRLDTARAARLVFDLETIAGRHGGESLRDGGVVPASRRRRAAEALRRIGAGRFAERLEARDGGPWRAFERWLSRRDRPDDFLPVTLEPLFEAFGLADARLSFEEEGAEPEVLFDGPGGVKEHIAACGRGRLILRSAVFDEAAAALFAAIRRELAGSKTRPSAEEPERRSAAPAIPTRSAPWIGEHPALVRALERIAKLAPGDLPMLVLGESGTGKELAAREIHRRSRRHRAPFVSVNCAALSENLLLSDLFGHARGAFTGADRERLGVFETAQGGTVFLDEIGDLPADAQGKLLRVLQEGEVRRLGESLARKVDVRVVAATHRDLLQAVRDGTFRQDLYYRLRGASVTLPPLRERGDDVLRIAERLIEKEASRLAIHPVPRLERQAAERLLRHSWPGNVRELENVVRVACQLAAGEDWISAELLEIDTAGDIAIETQGTGSYRSQVDELRSRLLREALAATGGKRAAAARALGLSRQALTYLIRELRLDEPPIQRG